MTVRALTFDLDDTLWHTWPTIERAERRLHAWLDEHFPAISACYSPAELRELRVEVQRRRPDIGYDLGKLREEGLRLAAERVGVCGFDAAAAFAVFHRARNDVIFFDDAVPTLERLARQYPLGALSNGNADVREAGLGHLFDFALSAADVAKPKPDPAMFDAALRALGDMPAAEVVHIGDDPRADVFGARQAGWRAVWLNRSGEAWPHPQPLPDAQIRSLDELDELLQGWH